MPTLGIDIGGTSIKLAAMEKGLVLWTAQSAFYTLPTAAELRRALRDAAADRVAILNPSAIGLCVPGLFDDTGRRITLAVNVPGLVGISLDELAGEAFGLPLPSPVIVNDARAAAADLFHARQLRGRLLAISIGTGVGAAVLDDGVSLSVEGSSPGHIGQFDVSLDDHPPIAPDGGAGGLEAYVGAATLKQRFGDDLAKALPSLRVDDPALRALARAIRISHAIYRPNHVCLLGGIGNRLRPHIGAIRALVDRNLTSVARPNWTFACGDHDFHAACGAARLSYDLQ